MRRLKLLKLASFSGYGIDVTQNKPVIEVEDGLAERLLATGYFEDLTPKGTTKAPAAEPQGENEKAPELSKLPQGEEVQVTDEIESVAEPSEDMQEAPKSKGGRKK